MTKASVSMQDFLRTGEFGPARLGISRRQLQDYLGEPEDWGLAPKAKHHAGIWKYGDIEFHFSGDALWLISADDVESMHGGRAIDLDPWILNGGVLVGKVLEGLAAVNIAYERIRWAHEDATERFRVGAGVELLFLDESQHMFCDEGASPLARPGMTFGGFSYSSR